MNRKMKRSDISGFTIKAFGVCVEVVTIFHIPVTLAIYDKTNRILIKRFGK